MTPLCTPHDDPRTIPVHHSTLKRMALSPAHYLHAATHPSEQTRPMRVGSLVHALVLGGKYARWPGDRRAKGYAEFEAAADGYLVVTASEYDDAAPVAEAVLASKVAAPWLRGRTEVPLEWTIAGRKCATRGIDILGESHIGELKTTHVAAPHRFTWEAKRMAYHAQLAWYRDAVCEMPLAHWGPHGMCQPTPRDLVIIAVETSPPHPVVAYRLTPRAVDMGQRCNALWLEQLRVCEESGEWPGYVQDVVDLDVEEEVELEFDGD